MDATKNQSASESQPSTISSTDHDQDAQLYELYRDHRKQLTEQEHSLDNSLATAVLTVSGGGLAISLTVIDGLSESLGSVDRCLLIAAWVCLMMSLVVVIIEMKLNHAAHQRFCSILDEECKDISIEGIVRAKRRQESDSKAKFVRKLQWFAMTCCAIGTILLLAFAIVANALKESGNDADIGTTASDSRPVSPTGSSSHASPTTASPSSDGS